MQEDTSTTNIACSHFSCTFENSKILTMHLNTVHNITRYACKKYKLIRFLLAHQQKHHKSDFKCLLCPERFASANRLKLHMKLQHNNTVDEQKKNKFPCYNCSQEFGNRIALNRHLRTSYVHLPLDNVNDKGSIMDDIKQCFSIEFTSAIKGCLNKYLFKPKELMANEKQCLDYLKDGIIDTLKFYNESHILLKWSYTMDVQFTRPNHATGEDEFKNAAFSSDHHARDNTDIDQLDDQLTDMSNDIIQRIDKYSKEGSGWILCKIISFKLDLYRFRLSSGGKPVTIPAVLALKHYVMNIDSD